MLAVVKRVFDYFIWVMFFVLLVLGGIIFVTDRTYPGDNLYPFKLKFEGFVLATSKILNKQVDFSIDLVAKRSNEIAKILTPKNSKETLGRLDTQVVLTANSISQIQNPVERKKAATKYIAKLNQVSSTLTEKKREFAPVPTQVFPTVANNPGSPISTPSPTTTSNNDESNVSEQIDNTQETIEETIEEMDEIINQTPMQQQDSPIIPTQTPISTPQPTSTPEPTNAPNSASYDSESRNSSEKKDKKKEDETPTPIQENTPIPTEVPVSN